MTSASAIIIVLLVAAVALAVKSIVHRIRYGSSCCGAKDAPAKKIRVKDKDTSHYPHSYTLQIDGMHCGNCARAVENALNSMEGVWGRVSLEKKSAAVLSKQPVARESFDKALSDAGYTLITMAAGGSE
ncbi:MAG TPA: ATPase P [Treponema sp.]|nr:ATPase P [Treponema sp.]